MKIGKAIKGFVLATAAAAGAGATAAAVGAGAGAGAGAAAGVSTGRLETLAGCAGFESQLPA